MSDRTLSQNRRPPRIAVLSSVHQALDPRVFFKQARTLAAAGFDVRLLAQHTHDETRDGVRIETLPSPRSRWGRPALWARLAARTWRLRPDLIHIHDPELLPLLLLLKWTTGAAAIYDAHEYYGEEIARRAWIPRPLRRPAARLTDAVEGFVARRIDAVVAVNEHMAAAFRRRGARAVAIHNFPEVREQGTGNGGKLRTQDSGLRTRHSVGYIGLLSPDRGLATVYGAARSLCKSVPGARVRVIGRVDWEGLTPEIPRDRARWEEVGVDLAGTVPAEEVPAALEGIVAGWIPFLDTGNNRRTIPLKLLEYMAAGKPVVASEIGFIATIVRASRCGLLVPPGDPGAHAAALAHLLLNPEAAQEMGAAGRTAVLQHYRWEVEGEKLVRLYGEAMHHASAARGPASQSA